MLDFPISMCFLVFGMWTQFMLLLGKYKCWKPWPSILKFNKHCCPWTLRNWVDFQPLKTKTNHSLEADNHFQLPVLALNHFQPSNLKTYLYQWEATLHCRLPQLSTTINQTKPSGILPSNCSLLANQKPVYRWTSTPFDCITLITPGQTLDTHTDRHNH